MLILNKNINKEIFIYVENLYIKLKLRIVIHKN